jgi:hypothetical protein
MKVFLTQKRLLEIESSVAELRNGKYKTKFAKMVRKATRHIWTELKEWYEVIEEKRKEFGEQNPKSGRHEIKPGTDGARIFEEETREAMKEMIELSVEAIPESEFEKYVPETSGSLLDDLVGVIINDGSDPLDMRSDDDPEKDADKE